MSEPIFFRAALQPSLADVCAWTGAVAAPHLDLGAFVVSWVAPIEAAGANALVFFENPKYLEALRTTRATACLIAPRFAADVPEGTIALVTSEPYRAFALVVARIFPDCGRARCSAPLESAPALRSTLKRALKPT